MKFTIYVELEWEKPIGHIVGLRWKACRVLTFSKAIELEFVPPVGMTLYLDFIDPKYGNTSDPLSIEVKSVSWFERTRHFEVTSNRVKMEGDEDPLGHIEWMKAMEFKWEEEERHQ